MRGLPCVHLIRLALAVVCVAAVPLASADVSPAHAQSRAAVLGKVRAITPSCARNPNATIVGRLAGRIGFGVESSLSVEGCFNTVNGCERWLQRASGFLGGRIFLAVCEYR